MELKDLVFNAVSELRRDASHPSEHGTESSWAYRRQLADDLEASLAAPASTCDCFDHPAATDHVADCPLRSQALPSREFVEFCEDRRAKLKWYMRQGIKLTDAQIDGIFDNLLALFEGKR